MSKHRKPCGCVTQFKMIDGVIKFVGYVIKCDKHKDKKK
jgi:hypothetical protein